MAEYINNIWPQTGGVPYGPTAGAINQFMGNQALQQYNNNLPGYANAVGQRMQNVQSMLEGQLPQDVVQQIAQQSAERGIGGGQAGGPNTNAAYLRALGLNSLDLQQQGSQNLSQAIADTPTAELWNPASLWVPSVLAAQEASYAKSQLQTKPSGYSSAPGGFGATMGSPWGIGAKPQPDYLAQLSGARYSIL